MTRQIDARSGKIMLGYEFQHDAGERIDLSFGASPAELIVAEDFALPCWWPGLVALHQRAPGPSLRYGPTCWLEFDQGADSTHLAGVFLQVEMDRESTSGQAFLDRLAADLAGLDAGLAELNQHRDLRILLECADLPHFVGLMSGRGRQVVRLVCRLSSAEMARAFAQRFNQLELIDGLIPLLKGSNLAVSVDYELGQARLLPRLGFEVLPWRETLQPEGLAAILDRLARLVPETIGAARRAARPHAPGWERAPGCCLTLSHFKITRAEDGQLSLKTYVGASEERLQDLPLVYALGTLAYDFDSVARLDSFRQGMGGGAAAPFDRDAMIGYLLAHPDECAKLVWTLCIDSIPIYALVATAETYSVLVQLLSAERVSLPARLMDASARLLNGNRLPLLRIENPRGIYGWRTEDHPQAVRAFLVRVYHELRNPGMSPAHRALNYAATSAAQAAAAFQEAVAKGMQLESIEVEASASCRINGDCWDVKLRFFDPENSRRARLIYRFGVDVAELLPVSLGRPKKWRAPG